MNTPHLARRGLTALTAMTLAGALVTAVPAVSHASGDQSSPRSVSTTPVAQPFAKLAKLTGKVNAPNGYSLMAVAANGSTFVAEISGKKFALNVPATATKKMTFHIIKSNGTYASPVVVAYQGVKGKVTSKALKKSPKALLAWTGSKRSSNLGSIKFSATGQYAYFTTSLKGTGMKVATTRGVITSTKALGLKSASTRSKGTVNLRATEKDLEPGLDPDLDGLANVADLDDDGNGVLDIVQSKLFNDTVTKPTPVTRTFSLLVTPMDHAVNWHVSNGIDNAKLLASMNEFLGIYYQVDASAAASKGLAGSIKTYEVECYGLVYCNGDSSNAVTISPDCFKQGTPVSERSPTTACPNTGTGALNLPAGTTPADVCGPNVVLNIPNINLTMDDWLFKSCDLDSDGMPNIVQSADGSFSNEVKPRPTSTSDVQAGDTFTSYLFDSSGNELYSATQVLSAVFQTSPVVSSIAGTSVLASNGTTGQIQNVPAGEVELQFYRPQRRTIGDESGEWLDMGGLLYSIGISGGQGCAFTKADASDTSIEVGTRTENGKSASYIKDLAADTAPESAQPIKIRIDLKSCVQSSGLAVGRIMLKAMDQAQNQASVNFETRFVN